MKYSISEAVASILAGPKPIILLDTCSLLDIVRSAYRSNVNLSHLAGARELLRMANQYEIHIIATTTVEHEFLEHLRQTTIELEHTLADLAARNSAIVNAIECVGISYRFSVDGFAKTKLSDALQSIAKDLFAAGMVLDRDDECGSKAFTRVERYHAPAARGKSESKDCLIIEHYLKLSEVLRHEGFREKICFVSSNSSDYGKAPTLLPPLDREFQARGIEYVNNFAWALASSKLESAVP